MDERTENLINECKRQEESCLYTSAAYFEWLKSMRLWKRVFVVTPIILGALATWPLFSEEPEFKWFTGACALLAGLTPAIYKALDCDVSLDQIAKHAYLFKILQDRFRQAWRVIALGEFNEFSEKFDKLLEQMDDARSSSLTAPERLFRKARAKILSGHYDFSVDMISSHPNHPKQ